ncbi:hypothetical protein DFS34DRAFT_595201 [Phlyctochytrium arcticum]|nr:hypothetical protein DFS34DRAFT_595201 [Phlyctochytrium arcticum]
MTSSEHGYVVRYVRVDAEVNLLSCRSDPGPDLRTDSLSSDTYKQFFGFRESQPNFGHYMDDDDDQMRAFDEVDGNGGPGSVEDVYDSDGFNREGVDKDGFDADGYDRDNPKVLMRRVLIGMGMIGRGCMVGRMGLKGMGMIRTRKRRTRKRRGKIQHSILLLLRKSPTKTSKCGLPKSSRSLQGIRRNGLLQNMPKNTTFHIAGF